MTMGMLELDDPRGRYAPGSVLRGSVAWSTEGKLDKVTIGAVWSTSGKGTEDAGIGESTQIERPRRTDKQRFELRLPDGPYTFTGRLIALGWQLELALDDETVFTLPFVLSPFEERIVLSEVPDSKPDPLAQFKRK